MPHEASETKESDTLSTAGNGARKLDNLPIVPMDSALSKVIANKATEPATMSLALQDLAMLMGEIESEPQDENTERVRKGILLITQALQAWSLVDPEHRAVLSDLNRPAKKEA